MRVYSLITAAVLSVLYSPSNFAQSDTEQEAIEVIHITGQQRKVQSITKTDTALEDLPISIQIVDSELMQQQAVITAEDALKNVSGLTNTGSYNGGYMYYNSRGFNLNNWSNFRRNGQMIWNMGHHFADNIEQIEVLKGPASVLYGDIAPGGVLNFVTKKPRTEAFTDIELKLGQYGLIRPSIDTGGAFNDNKSMLYRVNASYERSDSFRDYVEHETVMLAPSFRLQLSDKLRWDTELTYKKDERVTDPGLVSPDGSFAGLAQLPHSRFLGEPDSFYNFDDSSLFSTLTYELSDIWTLRHTAYLTDTNREVRNIYFAGDVDSQGKVSRSQYDFEQFFEGWGTAFDAIAVFNTGNIEHQVLLGADYSYNRTDFTNGIDRLLENDISVFTPEYGASTLLNDPKNYSGVGFYYRRSGLYLQDQLSLFDDQLKLLLGVRYNRSANGNEYFDDALRPDDYYTPTESFTSPRVGLVYQPMHWLSAYISYTESQEINGLDWIDPSIQIKPTDAEQIEAGLKFSLMDGRLGITSSVFEINKRNVYGWFDAVTEPTIPYISWDQDGAWATYQGGHHQSRGIEFDINGKITEQLFVNATYAHIDAKIIDDPTAASGNMLEGNARNSGSIWLNYQFGQQLDGLAIGAGVFFKGAFYLSNANNPQEKVDSQQTLDLALSYEFGKHKVQLNVSNLTDERNYRGSFGVYEPQWPRRVILSWRTQL